jgi:hypothetical protein
MKILDGVWALTRIVSAIGLGAALLGIALIGRHVVGFFRLHKLGPGDVTPAGLWSGPGMRPAFLLVSFGLALDILVFIVRLSLPGQ